MNERYEDLVRHIENLRIIERRAHAGNGAHKSITQLKHEWAVSRAVQRAIKALSAELTHRRKAAAMEV
jgi:hypothetical protein